MIRRFDHRNPVAEQRQADRHVHLPLLDRLMDEAPHDPEDAPLNAAAVQAALHDAVRRDLEALLNARRPWRGLAPGLEVLQRSVYGYGLCDFAAGAFNDTQRRQRLRAEIAETIARFEPRLTQVVVDPETDRRDATLRLRIRGLINAEPLPEPVAFDTVIYPATANVEVR